MRSRSVTIGELIAAKQKAAYPPGAEEDAKKYIFGNKKREDYRGWKCIFFVCGLTAWTNNKERFEVRVDSKPNWAWLPDAWLAAKAEIDRREDAND